MGAKRSAPVVLQADFVLGHHASGVAQAAGHPVEPGAAQGIREQHVHICRVGVIDNIPPADPEDLTEAFGWRAEPKIVRAIAGTESSGPEKPALRAKALSASLEMMKGAAHLTSLLA